MNTASLEHLYQIVKDSLVRHTFRDSTQQGSLGSQGSHSDTHSGESTQHGSLGSQGVAKVVSQTHIQGEHTAW